MRFEPGFIAGLREDIRRISPEARERLERPGSMGLDTLVRLAASVDQDNVLPDHPAPRDVLRYEETKQWIAEGERVVKAGEVGFVVLAGGLGTRLGGVPKAIVELPKLGLTPLAQKLMSAILAPDMVLPTFIMASGRNMQLVAEHVMSLTPKPRGSIFEQFESCRLLPNNRIDFMVPGWPDFYPTGHGDVGPALKESGVLEDWPDIKHFVVANVDNLLASPDLALIGAHVCAHYRPGVTCEVVERNKNDHGGVLGWANDRLQVMEDFRLDPSFVEKSPWHSTNTMILDRAVIEANIDWKWHRVRKHVGNRIVVQYERLLQQYTAEFPTLYVSVPRDQRYLPIKDEASLRHASVLLNGNVVRSQG